MMRIALNRRLILEQAVRSDDGAGGFVESWVALGTLWGEVKPRTGRLANGETGALSVTGFKITVRGAPVGHSNRPQPGQQFRMNTRVFRIEAVTERDGAGLYLLCHCEEELAP